MYFKGKGDEALAPQRRMINALNSSMQAVSEDESLKKLENTFALEQIPRNQDQLTSVLESIVSSFADIDDILENCESVKEYNSKVAEDKRIPFTTVILYGFHISTPTACSGCLLFNEVPFLYDRH